MQPIEGLSVPRRALDVEDYIDILRRHKGWIFGPFLASLVVSVVGVSLWPNSYVSTAVIQIKPQQISPSLVPVTMNQEMQDHINTLSNQVMSRSALSAMILNSNLYPRERTRMPNEDVQDLMRKNIQLRASPVTMGGGRNVPAFQISFTYYNRHDAMKVVQQLASNFITEDVQSRNSAGYQQVELMQEIFNQREKELAEADEKMKDFRMANPGKLPDQLMANQTQLSSEQSRISALTQQLSQATNERMGYENQIQLVRQAVDNRKRELKAVQSVPPPRPKAAKVVQAENELANAKTQLAQARQQYKDAHPTVKALIGRVEVAERNLDSAVKADKDAAAEEAAKAVPTVAPESLQVQREEENAELAIQQYQFNIRAKDEQINNLQKQINQSTQRINDLNARIQSIPVGDQVYQDLLRQQQVAKEAWMKAESNLRAAQMSANVDQRNQGEKLEILDAASLPVDPTDPDRPLVISMGAALGLVLGLVLAGAREVKDTSLKNLKDVRAYTQMAVLGSIPLLENDFVIRRRRRIAWLGWTAACLAAVVIMAGSVVYYLTVVKQS